MESLKAFGSFLTWVKEDHLNILLRGIAVIILIVLHVTRVVFVWCGAEKKYRAEPPNLFGKLSVRADCLLTYQSIIPFLFCYCKARE